MGIIFAICIGLTMGALIGFFNALFTRNRQSKQQETKIAFLLPKLKSANPFIIGATFLILIIGLVWTIYFLILGIVDLTQTEFATNVSQLIVSVLTVFSIIVAFIQFLNEKK